MTPFIGKLWYTYHLTPDGCRFVLQTEKGEAIFEGVEAISMLPRSLELQHTDELNYLDEFVEYQITDHFLPKEETKWNGLYVPRVVIDHGYLRVSASSSDKQFLRNLRAFRFIGADIFVLLICRDFEFRIWHPNILDAQGS